MSHIGTQNTSIHPRVEKRQQANHRCVIAGATGWRSIKRYSWVKVLNMSLTGSYNPLLEILLNKAMSEGIVVVAADPGLTSYKERFLASLNNVIPVQTLSRFNFGNFIQSQSIKAPGENILTPLPHGTNDFVSGNSLAATQISAVTALLMEIKPDLTLAEAKTILQKSSAATAPKSHKHLFQGINAKMAVLELCKSNACS